MKVLIIDDDSMVLSFLVRLTQKRGYEVLSYSNPLNCPLNTPGPCPCTLDTQCPDIIITDFNMPYVNGIEFLTNLKRKGCKCANIALMSGTWAEADLKRISPPGITHFAKPFHLKQIEEWFDSIQASASMSDR